METLTHAKKLRDPNYFGAYELITGQNEDGSYITIEQTLEIVKAVREKAKTKEGGEEMVLYFSNQKPMILNSINTANITRATGTPFIEKWVGKKITAYVEKVKAFGLWHDAIRIRPNAPVISKPELNPAHKKWNGAKESLKLGNTTIEAIKEVYLVTPENEALLCKQ